MAIKRPIKAFYTSLGQVVTGRPLQAALDALAKETMARPAVSPRLRQHQAAAIQQGYIQDGITAGRLNAILNDQ